MSARNDKQDREERLAAKLRENLRRHRGHGEGLRLGTPEIVRRGMTVEHMPELAGLIARALTGEPEAVAPEVSAFRQRFDGVAFVNP